MNTALDTFKSDYLQNGQMMQKIDPTDYAKNPPEYDLTIGYDKKEKLMELLPA